MSTPASKSKLLPLCGFLLCYVPLCLASNGHAVAAVAHLTPVAAARPLQAATCGASWRAPVDAPVIDGYRPPANPYSAGNRGLEYGTVGGEAVSAVDDGEVTFAGAVGRSRFVVVGHAGGLRSTYAYVSDIGVTAGETVTAGQMIALADVGFHLTARAGVRYRDPTPLLIGSCFTVKLVPIPPPDRLAPAMSGSR